MDPPSGNKFAIMPWQCTKQSLSTTRLFPSLALPLQELHNHIVGFCAIYPWYTKCHSPPHYYGGKLIDLMLTEVLKCDDKIPVAPRSTPVPNRQKRTRKAYMPRVKVATSQ